MSSRRRSYHRHQRSSSHTQKVQILIQACDLKNTAGIFKTSSPFAVVTDVRNKIVLGNTEVIENTLNPSWMKDFCVDYKLGQSINLNVAIFDESPEDGKRRMMGSAMFEIGEVLGSKGTKAKRIRQGGVVVLRVCKAPSESAGILTLSLQGTQLRVTDRSHLPNAFFEISRQNGPTPGAWRAVCRSKPIYNNTDPSWEPAMVNMHRLCDGNKDRLIMISLRDHQKNGKHKRMGWFKTTVNELIRAEVGSLDARPFILTKDKQDTKNYGKVVVEKVSIEIKQDDDEEEEENVSKTNDDETYFNISLHGIDLKDVNNPFIEFSRIMEDGRTRLLVERSPHVKNTNNPVWDNLSMPLSKLCRNDLGKLITISLHDFKEGRKHKYIGQAQICVRALLSLKTDNPNDTEKVLYLKNDDETGRSVGIVHVADASIKKNGVEISDTSSLDKMQPNIEQPKRPTPTFIDYISGGCELQLCIAVDFSKSNGLYHLPSSLHYRNPDGSLNDYETAMLHVGSIINKYDPDNSYPFWGFGAKVAGKDLNFFQVGKHAEAHGIKDLVSTYRVFFKNYFSMSEKPVATDIIEQAGKYATWELNSKLKKNILCYTVLLILTDGDWKDVHKTKQAIRKASKAPLSIVIVGIGDGDLSDMQYLDDFIGGQDARDITQFVPFNSYRTERDDLTNAVFEEIPYQVVEYFVNADIYPQPPRQASPKDIIALEDIDEEEFVLDLKFNEAGKAKMTQTGRAQSSQMHAKMSTRLIREASRRIDTVVVDNDSEYGGSNHTIFSTLSQRMCCMKSMR